MRPFIVTGEGYIFSHCSEVLVVFLLSWSSAVCMSLWLLVYVHLSHWCVESGLAVMFVGSVSSLHAFFAFPVSVENKCAFILSDLFFCVTWCFSFDLLLCIFSILTVLCCEEVLFWSHLFGVLRTAVPELVPLSLYLGNFLMWFYWKYFVLRINSSSFMPTACVFNLFIVSHR